MEMLEDADVKESRTDKLLKSLSVDKDFLDPELPTGYLSYSQYQTFLACGKNYEFKYIQKLSSGSSGNAARGIAIHAGVESMLRGMITSKPPPLQEAEALVDRIFESSAEGVSDWGTESKDHLKDKTMRMFRHYAVHALPKLNPVATEKGFAKKIGDVPVIGWIDLIDEQPAMPVAGMSLEEAALVPRKRVIVDLKTTRRTWDADAVKRNAQLTQYAYVEGSPHVRIDQLIDLKTGPKYVQAESLRTPEDTQVFMEHLNEVAGYIKSGVFPRASIDSWKCNAKNCPFWDKCRGRKIP